MTVLPGTGPRPASAATGSVSSRTRAGSYPALAQARTVRSRVHSSHATGTVTSTTSGSAGTSASARSRRNLITSAISPSGE